MLHTTLSFLCFLTLTDAFITESSTLVDFSYNVKVEYLAKSLKSAFGFVQVYSRDANFQHNYNSFDIETTASFKGFGVRTSIGFAMDTVSDSAMYKSNTGQRTSIDKIVYQDNRVQIWRNVAITMKINGQSLTQEQESYVYDTENTPSPSELQMMAKKYLENYLIPPGMTINGNGAQFSYSDQIYVYQNIADCVGLLPGMRCSETPGWNWYCYGVSKCKLNGATMLGSFIIMDEMACPSTMDSSCTGPPAKDRPEQICDPIPDPSELPITPPTPSPNPDEYYLISNSDFLYRVSVEYTVKGVEETFTYTSSYVKQDDYNQAYNSFDTDATASFKGFGVRTNVEFAMNTVSQSTSAGSLEGNSTSMSKITYQPGRYQVWRTIKIDIAINNRKISQVEEKYVYDMDYSPEVSDLESYAVQYLNTYLLPPGVTSDGPQYVATWDVILSADTHEYGYDLGTYYNFDDGDWAKNTPTMSEYRLSKINGPLIKVGQLNLQAIYCY